MVVYGVKRSVCDKGANCRSPLIHALLGPALTHPDTQGHESEGKGQMSAGSTVLYVFVLVGSVWGAIKVPDMPSKYISTHLLPPIPLMFISNQYEHEEITALSSHFIICHLVQRDHR